MHCDIIVIGGNIIAIFVTKEGNDMKTVMVTGASGLIGMEVCSSLLAKGYKVIGVDRQSNEFLSRDNYMFVQSTITDKTKLTSLINNSAIDVVVHLASSCDNDIPAVVTDQEMNESKQCDKFFFKACASAGIKDVILLSTTQVYASTRSRELIRETADVKGSNNYSKMKLDSEEALENAVKKSKTNAIILRTAPIYTAEHTENFTEKVYDAKEDVGFVMGDGAYGFCMCCLYNLVDFINALVAGPQGHYDGVFNVCDSKLTLVSEIVEVERQNHRITVVLQRNAATAAVKSAISISKKAKQDYRFVDMGQIMNNTCYDNTKAKRFSPFRWSLKNTK